MGRWKVDDYYEFIMTIQEKTLTVEGLEWFYRQVEPEKPREFSPILLLHGLPSHSYGWRNLMPSLGDNGFRAIAPDWLGSGSSAKPDKRDFAYTPDSFIKALSQLIDHLDSLKEGKISVIVQGFLGHLGINYALTHPDKIDRLIILNTPLSPQAKLPSKMRQWGIPFVGDMLTQDPLLVDRTLEGGSGFVISDQDLATFRQPYLKTSAVGRALVTTIQKMKLKESQQQIQQGWPSWKQPTLIIWGKLDPWLSVEDAQKVAETASNIELTPLEEAKHYPQEHWGAEISPIIVNFLRRQVG
jgi:haloalkane dehalogenase